MENQIEKLIQKYEDKLKALDEQGHDECFDCCDITALTETQSCTQEFIKELKALL